MSRNYQSGNPDPRLVDRICEMSVHAACGELRGPTPPDSGSPAIPWWQSCTCEDEPVRWDHDVSSVQELCMLCCRGVARSGPSRFSWLACETCKDVNNTLGQVWGVRPFAFGRHSLMNGHAIRIGSSAAEISEGATLLTAAARGHGELFEWQQHEWQRVVGRARAIFGDVDDIPLSQWQAELPETREVTADAIGRYLDRDDIYEAIHSA